ncbi:hypothetical protein K1W54_04290 [Micromonospora sp. CPCC 205371]|nr:hypothetical protein [Micromonospora sp. CPCC 205371]
MTTIEYDELTDDFYAKCHDCDWESRVFALERNARQAADRHDELHDDGVIS